MSSVSTTGFWRIKMNHAPRHASELVGQWARTAYGTSLSLASARDVVFIKDVSGLDVTVIDSRGRSSWLEYDLATCLPNRTKNWTRISIQDNPMKFLENRVSLINDDKVATACRDAITRLTKCFAQKELNLILPDSRPLKALEGWCKGNCPEAMPDVQILRKTFSDFKITKKNYIPPPTNEDVRNYARVSYEWGD